VLASCHFPLHRHADERKRRSVGIDVDGPHAPPADVWRLGSTLWLVGENGGYSKALDSAAIGGAKPVGAAAVETQRIVEGIPAYGIDMQSAIWRRKLPQTRGLHYSRAATWAGDRGAGAMRGQVHRHLRALELNPALKPASNEFVSLPALAASLAWKARRGQQAGGDVTSVPRCR